MAPGCIRINVAVARSRTIKIKSHELSASAAEEHTRFDCGWISSATSFWPRAPLLVRWRHDVLRRFLSLRHFGRSHKVLY